MAHALLLVKQGHGFGAQHFPAHGSDTDNGQTRIRLAQNRFHHFTPLIDLDHNRIGLIVTIKGCRARRPHMRPDLRHGGIGQNMHNPIGINARDNHAAAISQTARTRRRINRQHEPLQRRHAYRLLTAAFQQSPAP